jgi:hypothetical protein
LPEKLTLFGREAEETPPSTPALYLQIAGHQRQTKALATPAFFFCVSTSSSGIDLKGIFGL